jgi:hypothetical protein
LWSKCGVRFGFKLNVPPREVQSQRGQPADNQCVIVFGTQQLHCVARFWQPAVWFASSPGHLQAFGAMSANVNNGVPTQQKLLKCLYRGRPVSKQVPFHRSVRGARVFTRDPAGVPRARSQTRPGCIERRTADARGTGTAGVAGLFSTAVKADRLLPAVHDLHHDIIGLL